MLFTKIVEKEIKVKDETRIKELEQELKQVKADFASEKRIADNEFKIKLTEATAQKEKENNELRERNAVLSARVEILEKAFENMGFDVKDMKEILNKLVDGLVSKNSINVVK